MNKNAQTYTLLIIPERNGERAFSVCLSRNVVILLAAGFCMVVVAAVFLMVKSAEAAKKLHYFYALRNENELLTKENSTLRCIHQKIGRIDSLALYLEGLSAISLKSDKTKLSSKSNEIKTGDTAKTTSGNRITTDKKNGVKEYEKNAVNGEATDLCGASIPATLPVEGWITQQFLDDTSHGATAHPGIDIAAAEGMIIKAPASGTVVDVEEDQYYGNLIVIKHNKEFTTRYGHCAKVFIGRGEKIERGQTIALVGNTGHSTAPHLHYEVIRNGKNVNPLEFLSSENK